MSAYLILLSLSPLPSRYQNWSGVWGFYNLGEQFFVPVWWLTEYFAAFTLLGYIVAESHGRRNITQGRSILWSCFWCGLAAALLEVCRGFHPRYAASFLQGLFAFTGSLYGSLIYWLTAPCSFSTWLDTARLAAWAATSGAASVRVAS